MSLFNISSDNGQNNKDNEKQSNLDQALKIIDDIENENKSLNQNNKQKTVSEELGITIPSDEDYNTYEQNLKSISEELYDLNEFKEGDENNVSNNGNINSINSNIDNDDIKNKKIKKSDNKKAKNKKGINLYSALTERITGMGYSYNMLSLLKTVLFFGFIIFFFAYLHKLKLIYIVFLIISLLLLIPFSVYFQYKYLYEQKRFNQLKTYLKFMRLNFKQYQKIIIALKETNENFSESDEIYNLILKAINEIENGNDFRSALDIIEIPFKNSYITKLHAYMILAETEGGKSAFDALDTIDFETWEGDTYIFQTQKFKFQGQNSIYTLLGLAISLSIIFIFNNMMKDPSTRDVFGLIFEELTFQLITFFYILIDLVSFIMIKTMITSKWVREDE